MTIVSPSSHMSNYIYVCVLSKVASGQARSGSDRNDSQTRQWVSIWLMPILTNQCSILSSASLCWQDCNSPITDGRKKGSYNCSHVAWFGFKMAAWPTMHGISTILHPPCQGAGSQVCRSHAGLKLTDSYLVSESRVQRSAVILVVFKPQENDKQKKNMEDTPCEPVEPATQPAAEGKEIIRFHKHNPILRKKCKVDYEPQ